MANLPRFGRTWQRFSSLPRPAPAVSEPEPPATDREITPPPPTTKTLQPFEPNPPPKIASLPSSPIREHSSAKKISSPLPAATSPPAYRRPDEGYRVSRTSSPKTTKKSPPPSPKYRQAAPAVSPPTHRRFDEGYRLSRTSSPKTTKKSPPPSPKYGLHAPAVSSPAYRRTVSPTSSPKTTRKSPPPSPKYRQPTPPVSPLKLPRSEVKPTAVTGTRSWSPPEVEKKDVMYRETTEIPGKYDRRQESSWVKPPEKKNPDVVKISGENIGAVMHISLSSDGPEIVKKKELEGSSGYENGDRQTIGKEKREKMGSLPMKSFMNSNFQGVNNSLLYNSSCSHRDPGLHLAFSGKSADDEAVLHSRR